MKQPLSLLFLILLLTPSVMYTAASEEDELTEDELTKGLHPKDKKVMELAFKKKAAKKALAKIQNPKGLLFWCAVPTWIQTPMQYQMCKKHWDEVREAQNAYQQSEEDLHEAAKKACPSQYPCHKQVWDNTWNDSDEGLTNLRMGLLKCRAQQY